MGVCTRTCADDLGLEVTPHIDKPMEPKPIGLQQRIGDVLHGTCEVVKDFHQQLLQAVGQPCFGWDGEVELKATADRFRKGTLFWAVMLSPCLSRSGTFSYVLQYLCCT